MPPVTLEIRASHGAVPWFGRLHADAGCSALILVSVGFMVIKSCKFFSEYFGFNPLYHSTYSPYSLSICCYSCQKNQRSKPGELQRKKCYMGYRRALYSCWNDTDSLKFSKKNLYHFHFIDKKSHVDLSGIEPRLLL